MTLFFMYKDNNTRSSNIKEVAYSFLKQYPTSAVECILVHLSMSCGIVSLQFDLSGNREILNWHEPNLQQ